MSFNPQLERFDQFRPTEAVLLCQGCELIETHAFNFDANLFHPLDKGVASQQYVELRA